MTRCLVRLCTGDIETAAQAALLNKVADRAYAAGAEGSRSTNDTTEWLMPDIRSAGEVLAYLRGLRARPSWWHAELQSLSERTW